MITESGRLITGALTETGRMSYEVGRYPISVRPAVRRGSLSAPCGMGDYAAGSSPAAFGAASALSLVVIVPDTAGMSSLVVMLPDAVGMSALVVMAGDGAASSPCGIGVSCGLSAPLQCGLSQSAQAVSLLAIGSGGYAAALAAPLRLASGLTGPMVARLSIDGPQYRSVLSQAMPLTGAAGAGSLAAPLALANPSVLVAPYSVTILIDGRDVTDMVSECSITSSETALFDTLDLSLPDGTDWPLSNPPAEVVVQLSDETHTFMVEEFGGQGATRTIWGRPHSALYAEPWSAPSVWSNLTSAAATSAELATAMAGAAWSAPVSPLPRRYEVAGTPSAALQALAAAYGCLAVFPSTSSGITVRRKWPVRPVDMATAALTITRETAISDIDISKSDTPPYGSVTVLGYSNEIELPSFDVEGSPVLGKPAYVRLYWTRADHPNITSWITSGGAQSMGTVYETVTETLVFENGQASASHPVWNLDSYQWLGVNCGSISWQQNNGYGTGLHLASPGHGVASVTYRTCYDRWYLSGQAVTTVQFGIDMAGAAVAARVQLASGGADAGEVKQALLADTAACVAHGEALLDDSRVRSTVRTTIPRNEHLDTGATVWVEDELTNVAGFGKLTSVVTRIKPTSITQAVEVALI